MRVLNVCETARGGVGTYLDLISGLGARGIDMRYLLPREHAEILSLGPDRTTFARPRRGAAALRAMLAAFRTDLRRVDPDICFFHSSFALAALGAMRLSGDRRPALYCPHGWAVTALGDSPAKQRVARAIEGRLSGLADRTLCVSAHEHEIARRYGYRGRFDVVENAVPDARPDARADLFATEPDAIHLLFVGRLDRQKGFDLLCEAMAQVARPDLRLHVVGEAVRGDAVTGGLPSGVRMQGWVPASRIDDWYRSADALIVPSRWEAFGLVVPEAFRNGTPVFCSDRGALPALVEPGRTGGHVTPTVPDLARLLASLDKTSLRAMRPACRAAYEARFRIGRLLEQLEALMRGMVAA